MEGASVVEAVLVELVVVSVGGEVGGVVELTSVVVELTLLIVTIGSLTCTCGVVGAAPPPLKSASSCGFVMQVCAPLWSEMHRSGVVMRADVKDWAKEETVASSARNICSSACRPLMPGPKNSRGWSGAVAASAAGTEAKCPLKMKTKASTTVADAAKSLTRRDFIVVFNYTAVVLVMTCGLWTAANP